MAGKIAYELTADEAKFMEAMRNCINGAGGLEAGMKKVTEESKIAAREQAEMGRMAKEIMEGMKGPTDQYYEAMAKLDRVYKTGQISLEAYEQEQKRLADACGKGLQALNGVGSEAKNAGDKLKIAGENGASAFGSKAIGELASYAAGMVSVGGAIAGVKAVFSELSRIKEEAAQHARESEFSYGSLAEVSGGSEENFKKNVAAAQHIAATTGMSENQATKLTFALSSAGAMDEADTFASAYKEGVVQDPETLLRASTAMRKAFGGKKTNKELLNIAFGAAEASPSKAAELLAASAGAGAYAGGAGITESELLAGTAVNATVLDPTGGAARGGTAMRSLAKAMARMGSGATSGDEEEGEEAPSKAVKGERAKLQARLHLHGSMLERLHQIKEQHFSEAELQKLFGRQEGLIAYRNILKGEKDYSASIGRQGEAQRTGLFDRVLRLPSTDPVLAAAKDQRIGVAEKIESDRNIGVGTNLFEAVEAHAYKSLSPLQKSMQNVTHGFMDTIQVPKLWGWKDVYMRSEAENGRLEDNPVLYRDVVQHLGGEEQVFAGDEDSIRTRQRYRKLMGEKVDPKYEADTHDLKTWDGAKALTDVAEKLNGVVDKMGAVTDRQLAAAERNHAPLGQRRGDPGDHHHD
jgi:hypothetical protein